MSPVATHAFHLEKLEQRFLDLNYFFCCIVTINEFIVFTISLYIDFLTVKLISSKFNIDKLNWFFLGIDKTIQRLCKQTIAWFLNRWSIKFTDIYLHTYHVWSSWFDLKTTYDKIMIWLKYHKRLCVRNSCYIPMCA